MKRDLSKYSTEYLEQPFENYQVKYRKRALIDNIQSFEGKVILEVGCGVDPLYNYIEGYGELIIVEPSELFLDKLYKDRDRQNNITFVHGTLEERVEELQKYNYDLIVVSSLLHEVLNPLNLLEKLYSLCSLDTILYLDVPNALSIHRILAKESGIIGSIYDFSDTQINMQQNNIFDLEKIKALLEKQGFKIIKSGSYFIKPFTHKQMQSVMDNKIIDEKILDGFYNLTKYLPQHGSEIFVQAIRKD